MNLQGIQLMINAWNATAAEETNDYSLDARNDPWLYVCNQNTNSGACKNNQGSLVTTDFYSNVITTTLKLADKFNGSISHYSPSWYFGQWLSKNNEKATGQSKNPYKTHL